MSAECQVDQLVRTSFFPDPTYRGVVVEVGAARPDYLSIGASFRASGWTVISIEPNPQFSKLWKSAHIEVLEYACGDHDEDDVPFYVVDSHGAAYCDGSVSYESFSSLGIEGGYKELQKAVRTDTREIRVKLRRLDTILREHCPHIGVVDILSVDVEGWELKVLQGFSFERHKPKVMIIENLFRDSAYDAHIEPLGYRCCGYLGPNQVYFRPEYFPAVAGSGNPIG